MTINPNSAPEVHKPPGELKTHPSLSSRHTGEFIVSLDFELYWGVRHRRDVAKYHANLVGARRAIPELLDLFTEFKIHATWATVGFLFFDRTQALLDNAPRLRPRYENPVLAAYEDLPNIELCEHSDSIFFAPSLIEEITRTPHQEIGTHSFSHYYCLEAGQTFETFRQDLCAACASARMHGSVIRSLVFPKNQVRNDYLKACAELGIVAYRGNPLSWLYKADPDHKQILVRRLARLLDAYVPLTGNNCSAASFQLVTKDLPVNIPASRYLRPYSPFLSIFEPLRFWRIKRDMTIAAKSAQRFHLWWHPHDFGANLAVNLAFLRRILNCFASLRESYGMESLNIEEAAARSLANMS